MERKQRAAAESSLVEQDEHHSEQLVRLRRVASFIAAVVANGVLVVGMAGLGIATLYTFPWQLPPLSGSWFRYTRTIILMLLFAYLMASMVWGTTLSGLARRLQEKLESTIEHNLRQWMQL
ncbi:MAG: hypothetical protein HY234_02995 [Acidobacteria bacterium]|nr:hypothetical protein [Acidobacteriota bacterium]MBI3662003.1 hypothetical protein [Acidobacteriota bacterium]